MAELIENGFFETNNLSPWERCTNDELGERWICLEEEEPAFLRAAWIFSAEGGLSDENWIFLSEFNLLLKSNDGVVQHMPPNARATGEFSLWLSCQPIDYRWGEFYAFVCYRDHTFNYRKVTIADLNALRSGPYHLTMAVPDKTIEKIILCVVDASDWFVNGISLPGTLSPRGKGLIDFCHFYRHQKTVNNRLAMLETKIDKLLGIVVNKELIRGKTAKSSRKKVD